MSHEEIEIMREGGDILGRVHGLVSEMIQPGLATIELDRAAEAFIRDHQAEPAFKGFNGFSYSLCISVNETVVHGLPSDYVLREGDIISVDCGVRYKGLYSDSAYTYTVGEVAPRVKELLRDTAFSLDLGIAQARPGNRIGDIGYAIQSYAERRGFSIVRELVGHGIGHSLHTKPEVPNYGIRGKGPLLTPGMCLAIEPMINLGRKGIRQEADGWTIRTADRMPSAHFEHTVAVTEQGPSVLTTFKYIAPKYHYA